MPAPRWLRTLSHGPARAAAFSRLPRKTARHHTVNGWGIVRSAAGNAAGQVTSWERLDQAPGGTFRSETFTYNALGQMTRAVLAGMLDIEYRYAATANDGRITSRRDLLSGEEVTYQDVLGRLERAETVGPEWGLAWSFDGFGNRTQQGVVKGSGPVMSVAVNGLTNRVIGDSYDANGNLTATAGGPQRPAESACKRHPAGVI